MVCIWMPYIEGGSGADVSTAYLAAGLQKAGYDIVLQRFHSYYQFAPWLLKRVSAPPKTNITLTNSWNGFAFVRHGTRLVAVDRLCVHDPALEPYKTTGQRLYHNQLIRRYVTATAKRADALVAVSNYTANLYPRELGLPRPTVITNAVDTDFFIPAKKVNPAIEQRTVRLLFVGNLSRRKGADMLTPIMRCLGEGFELYYTTGLRASSLTEILPNMHPLGRLNQTQMREQYQAADFLLFPSRGEGLPRAVMEALSCGTPVVAAKVSSLPEAVDEQVGALCPLDDVNAFAATVRRLACCQNQYNQFVMSARQRAEERFSLTRMLKEYMALFETIMDKTE